MRDTMRLIISILAMPFLLVATFIVFWIAVGLTFLEFILSIPLLWFEAADGKFSDGTFPLEENLADQKTNIRIFRRQRLEPTPEAS